MIKFLLFVAVIVLPISALCLLGYVFDLVFS
jgi:hypothetical protein